MIRKKLMLAATSLIITVSQTEAAPTPRAAGRPAPPVTTLRCLVASNTFAERETDQKRKELARESLLFYLGRLDPATGPLQLKSAIKQTFAELNGVNAGALMNECLSEVRAKASMWGTTGQQLLKGK